MFVPPVVTELADGAAELVTLEVFVCAFARLVPRQLSVRRPVIISRILVLNALRLSWL